MRILPRRGLSAFKHAIARSTGSVVYSRRCTKFINAKSQATTNVAAPQFLKKKTKMQAILKLKLMMTTKKIITSKEYEATECTPLPEASPEAPPLEVPPPEAPLSATPPPAQEKEFEEVPRHDIQMT